MTSLSYEETCDFLSHSMKRITVNTQMMWHKKAPHLECFLSVKNYSLDFTYRAFRCTCGMHRIRFECFGNFTWTFFYWMSAFLLLHFTARSHGCFIHCQVNGTVWNINFDQVTIFNQTNCTAFSRFWRYVTNRKT